MPLMAAAAAAGMLCCAALLPAGGDAAPVTYANTRVVSPASNFELHWTIDGDTIRVKLQADSAGWIGFGIGEAGSGSMPGSDIVICGVNSNGEGWSSDRFATKFEEPSVDGSQDWTLVAASNTAGVLTCELSRLLDTGDALGDRRIEDKGQRTNFVFAYGLGLQVAYHGANRWAVQMDLYSPAAPSVIEEVTSHADYAGYTDFTISDYSIPQGTRTTYHTQCFTFSSTGESIFQGQVDIIGVNVLVPLATQGHVHHMVVNAFKNGNCDRDNGGDRLQVYAWTAGQDGVAFPSTVGAQFGSDVGYISIELDMHYDNPSYVAGLVDNTTARLYHTAVNSTLRPQALAAWTLGDNNLFLSGQGERPVVVIPQGLVRYDFKCPGTQTATLPYPITVIGNFLHMHATGKMMETRVVRNGVVQETRRIEYYDFNRQKIMKENNTYEVQPGDDIFISCWYESDGTVEFGQGSEQEMCIDFVSYYPKVDGRGSDIGCAYQPNDPNNHGEFLGSEVISELPRTWGTAAAAVPPPPGDQSGSGGNGGGGGGSTVIIAGAAAGGAVVLIAALVAYKRSLNRKSRG